LAGQGDLLGHLFFGHIFADANAVVEHLTLCVRYQPLILSNL